VADAIELYKQVFGTQEKLGPWARLLLKRDYLRTSNGRIVEETYEQQINYLTLVRDQDRAQLVRATLALFDVPRLDSPAARATPYYFALNDLLMQEKLVPALQSVEPIWPPGPFDGTDPNGKVWVPEHVKETVRVNAGIQKQTPKK